MTTFSFPSSVFRTNEENHRPEEVLSSKVRSRSTGAGVVLGMGSSPTRVLANQHRRAVSTWKWLESHQKTKGIAQKLPQRPQGS